MIAAHVRGRSYVGSDDPSATLAEAEAALDAASNELDDVSADIELRRSLGAERFRRLVDSAVQSVDEAQAAYEDAARKAEGRSIVEAVDLIENAELDELGELLRGTLETVVVERGRGPIAKRVRLIPRDAPSEVWTPTA